MTAAAPELVSSAVRQVLNAEPLITFPTTGGGSWEIWNRFLAIRDAPVFEIGNICGTCEFWFRRLDAEAEPFDIQPIQQSLTSGVSNLDIVIVDAFERLLQSGAYHAALFRLVPTRVERGSATDYFTNEQQMAWPEFEDEVPNDPGTHYYRVRNRSGVILTAKRDCGFEFLVPLQSSDKLDAARIAFFTDELKRGASPTAVAVGVLDIKQYYDSPTAHWCLSHYLLDGHHKVEAAAQTRQPITLLSFIAADRGVASTTEIEQLLANYGREGDATQDT